MIHFTEASMLDLLQAKLTSAGNGGAGEYAFLRHVRNAAGFDATRTLDAVSVSLWPSRGLQIEGYEVKTARSDWVRELKNPAKADDACRLVDRFWIVAPKGIVRDGELPATWGLMEPSDGKDLKLRVRLQAPVLHDSPRSTAVSRSFLVALLRSCPGAIPGGKLDLNERAIAAAGAKARKEATDRSLKEVEVLRQRAQAAERIVREFQQATGVSIVKNRWGGEFLEKSDLGWDEAIATIKLLTSGDKAIRRSQDAVASAADQLRRQADALDRLVTKEGGGVSNKC